MVVNKNAKRKKVILQVSKNRENKRKKIKTKNLIVRTFHLGLENGGIMQKKTSIKIFFLPKRVGEKNNL